MSERDDPIHAIVHSMKEWGTGGIIVPKAKYKGGTISYRPHQFNLAFVTL